MFFRNNLESGLVLPSNHTMSENYIKECKSLCKIIININTCDLISINTN